MKNPEFYLTVGISCALLQLSVLPAFSEKTDDAIWQKLSGAVETKPENQCSKGKGHKGSNPHTLSYAKTGTLRSNSGQVMLFLKNQSGSTSGQYSPAAALSIHPVLSEDGNESLSQSTKASPVLIAMNDKGTGSKQLIAQLAPDQVIAQEGQSSVGNAQPIPSAMVGTIDLEELKSSNTIDLKVSQSRTFRLKNKVVRTSISDPSIAEPIVVSENQLVLLGKEPGGATLVIWDDAGNSTAVDLRVSRDYSALQAAIRDIDPRIIVEPFSVAGSDRVVLMGDVDHPESIIRAFSAANTFMDDRGMKVVASNSRLVEPRIGEQGINSSGQASGSQTGLLSSLNQVDRYTYFANLNNNISKAQAIVSEGGRVTSLVRVRKVPLIALHVTFLEITTAAARELGVQLGVNFTNQSFAFGIGGNTGSGTNLGSNLLTTVLPGTNGTTGGQGSGVFPTGSGNPIFNLFSAPAAAALGFLQQGYTKTAGFGATSSPVQFLTGNTIPTSVGGQLVNEAISGIGQGVLNSAPALLGQSLLFGVPGGATFGLNNLANLFSSNSNFNSGNASRWSINPVVQGIITQSRARVLAEPTLVTISGERAAFLAGGEIALPESGATQGATTQTVSFEPFGIKLNMIPILLENGNINLQIAPEERVISNTFALQFTGSPTPIPGFTTRKTQTIVELKPGQELFVSGLVSANTGREIDKTPVIGEVPVLGALYRSKAFNKNESELVVAVRPEVILPGNPGQMKLPEELSKTEAPRDTNMLQVEPTVVDERYMTSGAADHSQQIPGVLPAGSPIPDSQ